MTSVDLVGSSVTIGGQTGAGGSASYTTPDLDKAVRTALMKKAATDPGKENAGFLVINHISQSSLKIWLVMLTKCLETHSRSGWVRTGTETRGPRPRWNPKRSISFSSAQCSNITPLPRHDIGLTLGGLSLARKQT